MSRKLTTEKFVRQAMEIHSNKYDYSKTQYVNAFVKITIICPDHGQFSQRPNHHTQGSGCPYCSVKKTTEMFITNARNKHGDKYDYSLVHYTTKTGSIKIGCKYHGVFLQQAKNHLRGQGCPHCSHYVSKQETSFLDYLNIPPHQRQIYITGHKVDGIDYNQKTIYEFLGDYWHGNPEKFDPMEINDRRKLTYGELYAMTMRKLAILKRTGFKVAYIWESDWKKFLKGQNKTLTLSEI